MEDKKSVVVSVVLTETILKALKDNKKETGIDISNFIRSLIMKWYNENKKSK
jgi:hypothetical protein